MDTIELKGKKYVIDYSFYSMCLIEDIEIGDLANIKAKPLKALSLAATLIYGIVNKDNEDKEYALISKSEARKMLESWIEENPGKFTDLLSQLVNKLVENDFFQKMFQPTAEKIMEEKTQE